MNLDKLTNFIFSNRRLVIAIFLLITSVFCVSILNIKTSAGFDKFLPKDHSYIQTYLKYKKDFSGGNNILIALKVEDGDIFNAEYLSAIQEVTNEVYKIPGVDKSKVRSIFTSSVRYLEMTEEGMSSGPVIPSGFNFSDESISTVRKNILNSSAVGRLVANDFSGSIVSLSLLKENPQTGEKIALGELANYIEENIQTAYSKDGMSVHVIGFSKMVGDIIRYTSQVLLFFAAAFLITALLVYAYSRSFKISVIAVSCAFTAMIWQLGLLPFMGGIDPMSILVPFLVFAIGISHGVQMISAFGSEAFEGKSGFDAAKNSFRKLALPGMIALLSDTVGFITITVINIDVVREMAIAASFGIAAIILTNLLMMPLLLSYINVDENYRNKLKSRSSILENLWKVLTRLTERRYAVVAVSIALVLGVFGFIKSEQVAIGDVNKGVPELHPDSIYNKDVESITSSFSVGVDVLLVFAESNPDACLKYEVLNRIDAFSWKVREISGVHSVRDIAGVTKNANIAWNEGYAKWLGMPRNESVLAQTTAPLKRSKKLSNTDCSVMPIAIFTTDHKASTISNIIDEIKLLNKELGDDQLNFSLASGNVGVMAATNDVVSDAQFKLLAWVFGVIILMCFVLFRSLIGILCIILPLYLVSLLSYALMEYLGIGLKINTLPVVALGVGLGVDYGIYMYSQLQTYLKQGMQLSEAYFRTLKITGTGIVFTGITLSISIFTWFFSPLKFQADMGIMLSFMILVNMIAAVILLPAVASILNVGGGSPMGSGK